MATVDSTVTHAYSMNGLKELILRNMESLLTEEELHDVVFVVGKDYETQQTFYGIRALFAIHSPVLRRMLYGSMMESRLENKVYINDCTVSAFSFIQEFFYGLNPILNESIIVDVLYVSKKYLITELEQGCIEYISSIKNIESVLKILSKLYKLSLCDVCLSILSRHRLMVNQSHKIWKSKTLLTLPKEIIIKLLQLSCADIKEETIWESCVEWSKYQDTNNNNNNNNNNYHKRNYKKNRNNNLKVNTTKSGPKLSLSYSDTRSPTPLPSKPKYQSNSMNDLSDWDVDVDALLDEHNHNDDDRINNDNKSIFTIDEDQDDDDDDDDDESKASLNDSIASSNDDEGDNQSCIPGQVIFNTTTKIKGRQGSKSVDILGVDHKKNNKKIKQKRQYKNIVKSQNNDDDDDDDNIEWKKHMMALLPFIRFPLMDSKYFVHNISRLGVLSDKEIIGIMSYFLDNTEISDLSFSYHRRINEFSFNVYCDKYGFVTDCGKTINVTNNKKKCLFSSSTTWNYGIHKWRYNIYECYVIAVGIITDYKICNEADRTLLDSSLSYFNSCGGDCCIVEEQKLDDLAKVQQWGEGDIIDIELNCNQWTLKFGRNGKQMGKIIKIKKNQLYHPVLASVGKNRVTVSFY